MSDVIMTEEEEKKAPAPPAPLTQDPEVSSLIEADREQRDNVTLASGYLTPRHRRFAQLAASGVTNNAIAKELGLSPTRVSLLIRNETILAEIHRLQEKIFEETIVGRMKTFTEPAMRVIMDTLTDVTGHVKSGERLDAAKWVIEMQHGKATQKVEGGENLLAALMDRLDLRPVAQTVNLQVNNYGEDSRSAGTPSLPEVREVVALEQKPKGEEELLDAWIDDFTRQTPSK